MFAKGAPINCGLPYDTSKVKSRLWDFKAKGGRNGRSRGRSRSRGASRGASRNRLHSRGGVLRGSSRRSRRVAKAKAKARRLPAQNEVIVFSNSFTGEDAGPIISDEGRTFLPAIAAGSVS